MLIILRNETMPIRSEGDIVSVRQEVRRWAVELSFSIVEQTKIVTAASELARNTLVYGEGGTVKLEAVENGTRRGLRLTFEDHGPGIPDLELALSDGYTSGTGLGMGLSGSKRLMNEFDIDSRIGEGTDSPSPDGSKHRMTDPLALLITEASQVGAARRTAIALAIQCGWSESERGKVALIVTEAANNLIQHANGGTMLMRSLARAGGEGIEVMTLDRGPGMRDITQCLRDGYSTAGTPGNGLGAISRLTQRGAGSFDLYSSPGQGTALLARIWSQPVQTPDPTELQIGVVCLPIASEQVCGDGWAVNQRSGRTNIMVVDGLGHGLPAADAARAALRSFDQHRGLAPRVMVESAHRALQGTRGAALAVTEISPEQQQLRFAGVGNIAGSLITTTGSNGLVSHNGIVGHNVRKVQEFDHSWSARTLLVLHSDGLETRWRLDQYLGLAARDPSLIAGVLYRDFARTRDDVTVLVARQATQDLPSL